MSILSQLFHGKITWQTAATQIGAWTSKIVDGNPALTAAASAVMVDLKQAASDAITTADTMAGPLLAEGADVVSAAFTTAATAYLGPLGVALTPAAHDAIDRIRDGLKAAIDMEAAALKAELSKPVVQAVGYTVPGPVIPAGNATPAQAASSANG